MPTGYYQKNKERLRNLACERNQSLSEEIKTESVNMLVNDMEIFQKMKNKG